MTDGIYFQREKAMFDCEQNLYGAVEGQRSKTAEHSLWERAGTVSVNEKENGQKIKKNGEYIS